MKAPVPLILRPAVAKLLAISVSTVKNRELHDCDFPKPILLSSTRIAYRSDDIARYQAVLATRAQKRNEHKPGIASHARESAAIGVAKRKARKAVAAANTTGTEA